MEHAVVTDPVFSFLFVRLVDKTSFEVFDGNVI